MLKTDGIVGNVIHWKINAIALNRNNEGKENASVNILVPICRAKFPCAYQIAVKKGSDWAVG